GDDFRSFNLSSVDLAVIVPTMNIGIARERIAKSYRIYCHLVNAGRGIGSGDLPIEFPVGCGKPAADSRKRGNGASR
ncbi:MAG: hypothetical protein WCB61_04985, partial [Pseudolabrys sp.]